LFNQTEAAIQEINQLNEDDHRLIQEYDTQIRAVNNKLRITKAQLLAERTNAELMVAIKNNMNFAADLSDL
jgi:hypothetical protein